MIALRNFFVLLALAGSCTLPVCGQPTRLWTDAEREFLVQELEQTRGQLVREVAPLTPQQIHFREAPGRWSVLEIVEHLEVQDEMYWRELDILPRGPQLPGLAARVLGNDEKLLAYEHDPGKADAGYLKPVGRFGTKELALQAFDTIRHRIIRFVRTTPKDLRSYYTFRNYEPDGKLAHADIYAVRDLHQLMLTCIAHTKRHIRQLQRVKAHPGFPRMDPYRLDGQPVHANAAATDYWLPIGSEAGYEALRKVCRYQPLIGGTYDGGAVIPQKDVLFGVLELASGGYYPGHHHPAPEIYYVLSGEAEWTVGDQTFTARPGESIYHPPGKVHRMVNKGKDPLRVVYFWWKPGSDPGAFEGYRFLEPMPKPR
jgi:quercetin dioxygenase-like cupin family protein